MTIGRHTAASREASRDRRVAAFSPSERVRASESAWAHAQSKMMLKLREEQYT